MSDSQNNSRSLGAAARITALASSIMDLHVRIALQEMDREKRRLISGVVFLATGGIFMLCALLSLEISSIFWSKSFLGWNIEFSLIVLLCLNLIFAGISIRLGGKLAKGPYLPETLEGISRTTKAVLGKT